MIDRFNSYVDPFPTVFIEVACCDVFLFESSNPSVATVEIEGDIARIHISGYNDEIYIQETGCVNPKTSEIKGLPFTGNVVIEGDNVEVNAGLEDGLSITQDNGNNIRISRDLGKLLVNGQEINLSVSSEETLNHTSIKIFTPPADLNAKIYGAVSITSQAKLRHVDVKIRPLDYLAAIKAQTLSPSRI